MVLDATNVAFKVGGEGGEGVAEVDFSAGESACHDGSDALGGKGAVDGETGLPEVSRWFGALKNRSDLGTQVVHALAGVSADGEDGGLGEGGALEVVCQHLDDEVEVLGEVGLG